MTMHIPSWDERIEKMERYWGMEHEDAQKAAGPGVITIQHRLDNLEKNQEVTREKIMQVLDKFDSVLKPERSAETEPRDTEPEPMMSSISHRLEAAVREQHRQFLMLQTILERADL